MYRLAALWIASSDGQHAGDEEDGHEVVRPLRRRYVPFRSSTRCPRSSLLRRCASVDTAAADDAPRREGVEDADEQHRGVRRPRDAALRVARLLAVERRRLEPDERREREHQRQPERAGEDGRRRERPWSAAPRRPCACRTPRSRTSRMTISALMRTASTRALDVDRAVAEHRGDRPADRRDGDTSARRAARRSSSTTEPK